MISKMIKSHIDTLQQKISVEIPLGHDKLCLNKTLFFIII